MSNESAISEFRAVTGIDLDSDTDKIKQLLEVHDGNLNNAVITYLDSGFDSLNPTPQDQFASGAERFESENNLSHRSEPSFTNLQSQMFLDDFLPRLPRAPRISNQWSLELGIYSSIKEERSSHEEEKEVSDDEPARTVKKPASALWIILLIVPKTLLQMLLSIFKYLFGGVVSASGYSIESKHNALPLLFNYDNYNFEHNYSDYLKQVVDTDLSDFNLHHSNYNDIHLHVLANYDSLLVILVNNSEESERFIKLLFTDASFKQLFHKTSGTFKDSHIYINNIDTDPESFEVAKTYKVKKLPYIMLLANVTNNPSIMPSMSMVYKSNIAPHFLLAQDLVHNTTKKIIRNLNKLLDNFNPQLITKRIDKQEMELSRLIKEQQDDAYLKSLEKDKVKKMNQQILIEKEKTLERLAKTRELFLFNLIKTNWFESIQDNGASIKIAIKLPNAKRIVEEVLKSISVWQLYLYVDLKLFVNELISVRPDDFANEDEVLTFVLENEVSENEVTLIDPEEYLQNFPFKFELVSPFPRKVIPSSEESLSNVRELASGGNFLVEFIEESDSEDEESI